MSNPLEKGARREEEIAFLLMEQVLGVDIKLADAGTGNKMPDGSWLYPGDQERRGLVEVTSPPDKELMSKWARAKRAGEAQTESGSVPLRLHELAEVCQELLEEEWARDNIAKLVAQPAEERHLFLFTRSHRVGHYFYRLTDSYEDRTAERVGDLTLPNGLTDVWFRGRSVRDQESHISKTWVARFQSGSPSFSSSIADDPVPVELRRPKGRGSQ